MKNRVLAWFNLAYRFNRHVLTRVPLRGLRAGADYERFTGAVGPEGYLPLTVAERALVPAAMQCVHCGVCALAPLAAAATPDPAPLRWSAWDEPWSFVVGPARSLDRATEVDAAGSPWATPAAAALCPTGVPIVQLAAMHHRLARAGTPAAPTRTARPAE
jgi:hypothetical protein